MKKKCAFHSVPNFREGGFFKLRLLFGVLLCFAGVTIVLFALGKASAQPRTAAVQSNTRSNGFAAANKIAPWVVEHTANGQEAEFFVVLTDQADLSAAESLPTKVEKGRFVYQTLQSKAQTTQDSILQWLRDHAIEHRSFYIVNAILVKGTRALAQALAAFAALTPRGQRSAMTGWVTRSAWRLGHNGLVAVTWTAVTAHLLDTSSAWNSFLPPIPSIARPTRATRARRLILPSTRGVV